MPPKETIYWNDNEPDSAVTAGWDNIINAIIKRRQRAVSTVSEGKVTPLCFGISKDGQRIIKAHQKKHVKATRYESAAIGANLHKAGMVAARLALILHVAGLVESDGTLYLQADGLPPITAETVTAACRLSEWYVGEAQRIYAVFGGQAVDSNELSGDSKDVLQVLRRVGKAMTGNEIKHHSRHCQRIADIERCCSNLLTTN